MRRRLVAVVSLVVVALAAFAPPAWAVKDQDPADSGLKIDVSLIKFVEKPDGVGNFTIRTHSGWKCRALRPAAKTSLKWLMDGSGGKKFDLVGSFVCRDGKVIFEARSKDGSNTYEPVVAQRPNRRTVKVSLPLDLDELDGNRLELVVKSKDVSGKTCIEDCVDRAPDKGRLKAN